MKIYFVLVLFAFTADAAYEGDVCEKDSNTGVCTKISKCPAVLEDIRNQRPVQNCGYSGLESIVCCVAASAPTTKIPVLTTTQKSSSTTTGAYIPPVYDYVYENNSDGCEPIPPSLTSNRTGQKAWDKCLEYQEQLVFPCVLDPTGRFGRANRCHHNAEELIIGGPDAALNEFPHMALLGYGDDVKTLAFLCGGALISDRFILTAGHCIASRDNGPVSYVALNVLTRAAIDPKKLHKVKRNIRHPDFIPSKIYNDIGLLELDNPIALDSITVPACLHNGASVSTIAIFTTWNTNDVLRTNSTVLQKFRLTKFTESECSKHYPVHGSGGYNDSMYICYADRYHARDVCQDDDGLVVVRNNQIACMYTIVGISSIGKGCQSHSPGLYTKVDHFIPWIESVVWP